MGRILTAIALLVFVAMLYAVSPELRAKTYSEFLLIWAALQRLGAQWPTVLLCCVMPSGLVFGLVLWLERRYGKSNE